MPDQRPCATVESNRPSLRRACGLNADHVEALTGQPIPGIHHRNPVPEHLALTVVRAPGLQAIVEPRHVGHDSMPAKVVQCALVP